MEDSRNIKSYQKNMSYFYKLAQIIPMIFRNMYKKVGFLL